ncbi:Zinc finger protein 626 like protein [Argiope bruennichi]|uniref:Zinc finger protein 626 like protein n=1 Tax=Argiope bruennichi TaxID=94029 RepID=A0A8T0EXT2_ARGBR|nr:Zinc finger protein 626 like protein [Argiope bruennichi]
MEKDVAYLCDHCKDSTCASENKSKTYRWLFSLKTLFMCAKCSRYFNIGFRVTDKTSLLDPGKNSLQGLVDGQGENARKDEGSGNEHKIQENHPTGSNAKKYKCDICLQTFKTKYSLLYHKKLHNENSLFRCEYCNTCSRSKSEYQKHLNKHSNIKRYKCNFCTAAYKFRSNLLSHMNVHKAENPYRCKVCHWNCSSTDNLKIHMKTHSESRPYKCHICPSSYNAKFKLTDHMKRIHQEDYLRLKDKS